MHTSPFLLHGQAEPPPPPVPLRAGPLRLLFEPASGFVRGVCLGEREVLRGLYAAVRDRNWGTVPPHISNLESRTSDRDFALTFDAACCRDDIDFVWRGALRGDADGVLEYTFEGEARTTFHRNRIGFCVLHPIRACAGAAARQTRVDGSVVEGRFPDLIEPQIFGRSSFRDLRAVAHEVRAGVWAEVEFDGDVFEMEDQRNWTDASFKTYCTPLNLPFPVEVRAGTRIRQVVTLRLKPATVEAPFARVETAGETPDTVLLNIPEQAGSPPLRLGLGMASHEAALTDGEIARLATLHLAHLRVDLRLATSDWPAAWARAARDAERLGVGLELALHLPRTGEPDCAGLRRRLQAGPARLTRVLALREGEAATTPATLAWVRQAMAGLEVPVGSGSDANFCELNREQALERLALAEADFLFWSVNPQVHAFDHRSLVETLEAQPDTVKTARAFAGGKPLVVSPITLKQRFNPVATGATTAVPPGELPPTVDPRQLSLFAAVWTLGSLAGLAGAGAESVTCYETTGWRGVMETERGSPCPERFPSRPSGVFPLYHLLAEVAEGRSWSPIAADAPGRVGGLSLVDDQGRRRVLLGNLEPAIQRVRLPLSAPAVRLRLLDATNVASALADPAGFRAREGERHPIRDGVWEGVLPPYALARLEAAA